MYNKAVDTYFPAIKFVFDRCKTSEMCDKAVDTCPFAFGSVADWYGTQKCVIKLFPKNLLC